MIMEGTKDIQQEWIPLLIKEDILIATCLTEPESGSDAATLKTKAIRDGDHSILSGEKASVSIATQAKGEMVFAKTDKLAHTLNP